MHLGGRGHGPQSARFRFEVSELVSGGLDLRFGRLSLGRLERKLLGNDGIHASFERSRAPAVESHLGLPPARVRVDVRV
jgi:hypothetical protein